MHLPAQRRFHNVPLFIQATRGEHLIVWYLCGQGGRSLFWWQNLEFVLLPWGHEGHCQFSRSCVSPKFQLAVIGFNCYNWVNIFVWRIYLNFFREHVQPRSHQGFFMHKEGWFCLQAEGHMSRTCLIKVTGILSVFSIWELTFLKARRVHDLQLKIVAMPWDL